MNFCSVYKSISFSVLVEIIRFFFFYFLYISLCTFWFPPRGYASIYQSIYSPRSLVLLISLDVFSLCLCFFLHLLISLSMPIFLLPCYPYALHRTNYLYLSLSLCLCLCLSLHKYTYIHIYYINFSSFHAAIWSRKKDVGI